MCIEFVPCILDFGPLHGVLFCGRMMTSINFLNRDVCTSYWASGSEPT